MMKARLEAYRRKKHKEEMIESLKTSIKGVLPWNGNSNVTFARLSNEVSSEETEKLCQTVKTSNQRNISKERIENLENAEELESLEDDTDDVQCSSLTKIIYLLYFFLWVTLYIIAIEIEFGAVYFVISTLVLICLNTRSRPKKKGELSAYSVFNPNCEAIEGTLDASQFEREIRYGPSSVR
ncbi:SAYSvFN domain-containing protein 1 [Vespula squamosa]|uniref:SAYSvFN domain-containing protein 1 n=1 Tax=Vespula squamosa TaxID=30214 RepID=A0ABD2A431_VESSQ